MGAIFGCSDITPMEIDVVEHDLIRINAETTDSEHDSYNNVQDEDDKDAGSDGALYDSDLSKSLLSLDHIVLVKLFSFV